MANHLDAILDPDPQWYKDAIIYEVHARAFYDNDADGMGDFRGLTQKLDYLQDLGVTLIWLLPFFPSPWRDDGYDRDRDAWGDPRDPWADDYDARGRTPAGDERYECEKPEPTPVVPELRLICSLWPAG